jgi:signal transduction histidine kinase
MLAHTSKGVKEKEKIQINAIIEQAFNLAYFTFREKHPDFLATVKMSYAENIPVFDALPADLVNVFVNLVDNACYALNEKQKKGVEGFKPTLELISTNEDDHVKIVIKDNGAGIKPDIIDKVFNPFFTTKPAGVGAGLGLSVTYDTVTNKHGGMIVVHSTPDVSTEFIVTLPYNLAATPNPQ